MTPLRKVEMALHGWNAVAENDDRGGEKLVEVHGYAALGFGQRALESASNSAAAARPADEPDGLRRAAITSW